MAKNVDVTLTDEQQEEISTYLYKLQASGETNMFGAPDYVEARLGYSKQEALAGWLHWTENYDPDESLMDD